jgi:flagellum-specific ATP synthase
VRGLLDGHVWLSRKLSSRGHYPAVDVLESLSRLMPDVVSGEHYQAAQQMRELLGAYRDHEDLISIGAYRRGSNPAVDLAIEMQEPLSAYLRQPVTERSGVDSALKGLLQLKQTAAQRSAAKTQAAAP